MANSGDMMPNTDWGQFLPAELAKKLAEVEGMQTGHLEGTAFKYYAAERKKAGLKV